MSEPLDLLVRAIAPDEDLRIVAAVTTGVVREAAERHALSPAASVGIGRAITSGLLLATMTKGDERVTLQIVGDGPLGAVTVDANSAGHVRAYVRHPAAAVPLGAPGLRPRIGGLLGKDGVVNVVRDLGLRELYQGQVELTSGEIDEDVERYLRGSEQVPSALSCDVVLDGEGRVLRSGGVLIQALPGGAAEAVGRADERLRAGALFELLAAEALGARAIAAQLAPSHPIEFLADRTVRFQCTCSAERIRDTLRMLGPADLDEMIAEGQPASVTCNFCNAAYAVEVDELRLLREAAGLPRPTN